MTLIEQIKRNREAGTPDLGGWSWFGGRDNVYLATRNGGRRIVMGFKRKGMRSAQPTFQVDGAMRGAIDELTEYQVGDGTARGQAQADADKTVYRMDIAGIDHPDARRIASVPTMEAALLAAEGLANWCDALIEMVHSTSCDPDDPEAFGEVLMGAQSFLATYRKAVEGEV